MKCRIYPERRWHNGHTDLESSKISNIFAGGIEIWCNGSTTDFGSVCPSSNLGISTMTLSEQSVDQVPDQKTGEFSDQQKDHGPERPGLIEA